MQTPEEHLDALPVYVPPWFRDHVLVAIRSRDAEIAEAARREERERIESDRERQAADAYGDYVDNYADRWMGRRP